MRIKRTNNTNQLDYVDDSVTTATIPDDIEDQGTGNYQYDAIGNLIQDNAEGISSIEWTLYGKISKITKTGSTITYSYDASCNRLSKKVTGTNASETWYVRDGSGNTMAVYNIETQQVMLKEQHLYGSSRLGINNRNINMTNVATETTITSVGNQTATLFTFVRGNKFFELTNHLGNVLVTVTDKKTAVLNTNGTAISYYTGDVVSANDYAPFGMVLQGRTISSSSYRYGFNGKEKSDEIISSNYNFGARIYDGRLGRWYSTDIQVKAYLSPYSFARNSPVNLIDPDGNDEYHFHYLTVTTYTPALVTGSDGSLSAVNVPVTKTYTWVQVIDNNLANTFYVHKDAVKSGNKLVPADPTQFFPAAPAGSTKRTGVTTSKYFGCIVRPDDDYTSLIKILDDFPELKGIVSGPYIHSPGENDPTRDFWNKTYADKSARESADKEKKQAINFTLGVLGFVFPVEELILGAVGKIGSAAIDLVAIEKNFKRFGKAVPLNSKSSISIEIAEDGNILFSATSPGRVEGSSALYQKLVNAKGETIKFIKTTFDPDGNIVHVKDKIEGTIIKMPEE